MQQRNNFKKGDTIEIFGPEIENIKIIVNEMYNEDMEQIDVAPHPLQIIYIKIPKIVYKNNLVRKIIDKDE